MPTSLATFAHHYASCRMPSVSSLGALGHTSSENVANPPALYGFQCEEGLHSSFLDAAKWGMEELYKTVFSVNYVVRTRSSYVS